MSRHEPTDTDSSHPRLSRRAAWLAVVCWLTSRGLLALLWSRREIFIDHDVRYYHWQLVNKGVREALVEYPTPIAVLLEAIRAIAGPSEQAFVLTFVLLMAAIDLAATVWLWCGHSRRSALYWSSFTFSIGSLVWFRIDLLPAVAVLAALVWLTRRPVASGVAIALGAATKLWPAILIGPMLGNDRPARRRLLGFGLAGGVLGLGSLLLFGWERSTSPLTWQSGRGLQIESIVATWPMLRYAFGPPGRYRTELSQYNAWEIYGPQVDTWLTVADWLLAATIALAVVLGWLIVLNGIGLPGRRSLPNPGEPLPSVSRTHAIVLAHLALICAVIVANKTFSPQYTIWLGGPLAVLVALPLPHQDKIAARWLAGLGLATALGTHLVFPLNYGGLVSSPPRHQETLLLAGRNLLMVVFTALSITLTVRAAAALGRPPHQPEDPRASIRRPRN